MSAEASDRIGMLMVRRNSPGGKSVHQEGVINVKLNTENISHIKLCLLYWFLADVFMQSDLGVGCLKIMGFISNT